MANTASDRIIAMIKMYARVAESQDGSRIAPLSVHTGSENTVHMLATANIIAREMGEKSFISEKPVFFSAAFLFARISLLFLGDILNLPFGFIRI